MSTVYAKNSSFSGTVIGATFTNGQATVTDAWKLVWFAEKGYGIDTAAVADKPATIPSGTMRDFGVAAVTGTLVVKTGLTTIETVVLTLAEDAAANGNEVSYLLSNQTTNPGEFTIKVWTGGATPAAATAANNVGWVAYGT